MSNAAGHVTLFEGQSAYKQSWAQCGILLVVNLGVITFALNKAKVTRTEIRDMLHRAMSMSYQNEPHSVRRLLVHGIRFSPWLALLGSGLTVYYSALGIGDSHFSCLMWGSSSSIYSLVQSMYPWDGMLFTRSETLNQWIFIVFATGLYFSCVAFWGPTSRFATDPHCEQARKVFRGLHVVQELMLCKKPEFKSINQWACNALPINGISDYANRRKHSIDRVSCSHRVYVLLYQLAQFPVAFFMSWPSLLFTVIYCFYGLYAVI